MEKSGDYSGELLPELDPEDFSSETLRDLLRLYSRLYMGLDGFWYLTVMEKFGSEAALDCDIKVWERARTISPVNGNLRCKAGEPLGKEGLKV